MKSYVNRPIPRLLRYELLLKGVLEEAPEGHADRKDVPRVLERIKALGKESEPGVVRAKAKVELWRYGANLAFKSGEFVVSRFFVGRRVCVCVLMRGRGIGYGYYSSGEEAGSCGEAVAAA